MQAKKNFFLKTQSTFSPQQHLRVQLPVKYFSPHNPIKQETENGKNR